MTDNVMDKNDGLKDNSKHLALSTRKLDLPLTEVGESAGVQSLGGSPGDL